MKTIILKVFAVVLFSACISCTPMYQVLDTKSDSAALQQEWFVSENNGIVLAYNLWDNNGKLSFVLTNNTDQAIYIDWNRSHFILNGVSYEYWYDEEQTSSFYSTTTSSTGTSLAASFLNALAGYPTYSPVYKRSTEIGSNKFKPKQVVELPGHSAIYVSKFIITKNLYYNCDFHMKYKSSRKSESVTFTEANSPVDFRNYITYSQDYDLSNVMLIDDAFYVSAIHNMNLKVFNGKQETEKYCTVDGKKATRTYYRMPYKKADSFYIQKLK